jgi:hypothetical protein
MSHQSSIAREIQSLYPESIIKKIDRDNFLDIHIPHVNQNKSTHLFFNTSKGKIKIGFYCRDVAFVENAVRKSNTIEQYSQGIRLADNPIYSEVDEAINAAVKLIKVIQNKPSTIKTLKKKGSAPKKLATPNDNKPLSKAKKDLIIEKPSLPIIEKKSIKKTSKNKEVQLDRKKSTTKTDAIFNSDSSKPNSSLIYLLIIIVVFIVIGYLLFL